MVLAALVVAGARIVRSDPDPVATFGSGRPTPEKPSAALSQLADVVGRAPVLFGAVEGPVNESGTSTDLRYLATDAAVAAAMVAGEQRAGVADSEVWAVDLTGRPVMADRVAIGLMGLGVEFERSVVPDAAGSYGTVLSGPGSLLGIAGRPIEGRESARIRLATIIELAGSPGGGLGPPALEQEVLALAATLELDVAPSSAGPRVTSVETLADVAGWAYVDPARVPAIGGRDRLPSTLAASPEQMETPWSLESENWQAATTGSLIPGAPEIPSSTNGGVGWNNREAQDYRPDAVSLSGGLLTITTRRRAEPDVDRLPFESGMVMGRELIHHGAIEIDIVPPEGEGLWPAVWLLDAEACERPGRCSGYASPSYLEIDILETRGDDPATGHATVHWWDERIRSATTTALIQPSSIEPGLIRLQLERRPGLLIWRFDGSVVHVVGGRVQPHNGVIEAGPHRSAPLRLVINTAVGGSFAGDRLVGIDGGWWGDARVPGGFPFLSWDQVETTVSDVRVVPLGVDPA